MLRKLYNIQQRNSNYWPIPEVWIGRELSEVKRKWFDYENGGKINTIPAMPRWSSITTHGETAALNFLEWRKVPNFQEQAEAERMCR